ncbi:MAG: GtrA family protein [Proteobacteria bacterium]|jgi:putative flippase GtrA|nr:GtrA family protein [Pseudomonadota bacterium]
MLRQFFRYAAAGAIGTAVQYAILVALVESLQVQAVAASTIGAVAGAFVNYGLNHRYTFGSDAPHARALPRFAATALAGIALNAAVVALLVSAARTNYLAAQVVATAAVLAFTFLGNRRWTF